jgi:hypothetical protein
VAVPLSNPNVRAAAPLKFAHQDTGRPVADWKKERPALMQTSTQMHYSAATVTKDAVSAALAAPVAGAGGRLAAAAADSKAWTKPQDSLSSAVLSPSQLLARQRQTDMLQAARNLQAKAAAAQQAANALFEASARERYEVARAERKQIAPEIVSSPFFRGEPGASQLLSPGGEGGRAHTQRLERLAARRGPGRPFSASLAPNAPEVPLAGLSSKRVRDWVSDNTVHLVSRSALAEERNKFENTFGRVMATDLAPRGQSTMKQATSATADALAQGIARSSSASSASASFTPHFLRKVDPSLHHNVRRAIFANGNEFVSSVTGSSKFPRDKFVPRAYGGKGKYEPPSSSSSREEEAKTTQQQTVSVAAPTSSFTPAPATAAEHAGPGFAGM